MPRGASLSYYPPRDPELTASLFISGTVFGAVISFVAACAPAPAERLARRQGAITNGQAHGGHLSVGPLRSPNPPGPSSYVCTATLVGRQTAIAAAHCMRSQRMEFTIGGAVFTSYSALVHPQYRVGSPQHDLGLLLLSGAPQVTPSSISLAAPSTGLAIALIGYGETLQPGDSRDKRITSNTVARVQEATFDVVGGSGDGGNACFGDSGAPGLTSVEGQEAVAGIVAEVQGSCASTVLARVDVDADWLEASSGGDIELLRPGESTGGCALLPAAGRATHDGARGALAAALSLLTFALGAALRRRAG